MALSDLQISILRELGQKSGVLEGLPVRAGVVPEAVEQAIGGLIRLRYATVVGPPNQNSDLGQDVDELRLLPNGAHHLRTLR